LTKHFVLLLKKPKNLKKLLKFKKMAIFRFSQFEQELFCWYFKRLNAFLAQCPYCVSKWEILGIIDEGVNNETRILLQYLDFHGNNIDEAWSLPEWVAWDSFEFDKASRIYGYSFPNPHAFYAKSYYAPLWCDMCNSFAHNVSSYPYYACYTSSDSSLPLTQCMRLEVGEPFGLGASFGMNNALGGLETPFEEMHTLVSTPLEGCRDVFVHEGSSSLACDNVLPNPVEHSHVFTFCSQPSFSPEYTYDVPIDNFVIYDFNVDLGNANNMLNVLGGNTDENRLVFKHDENFSMIDQLCVVLKT